ncbi:galactose mutarotase-like protein [Atractiella rhizophila]|nr:galactose mutarotase-like protein [Atractiella rhizophila]
MQFLELGATAHALWVPDRYGDWRDVLLGYDNLTQYTERGFFGPVVGRYANRIQNGTFSIPPTRNTTNQTEGVTVYHTPTNEHDGANTLHGGYNGYDLRPFKVLSSSKSQIVFGLQDPAGEQGFPGKVTTRVTYTLKNGGVWDVKFESKAWEKTPILLSSHAFWNLDAYHNYNDVSFIDSHHLKLAGDRVIATDPILIPTGDIIHVDDVPAFDFRKGMKLGTFIHNGSTDGFCGGGCSGYDNCWPYADSAIGKNEPQMSLWSDNSGIRLDITTNQIAGQVYSCNGINSTAIPRKKSQGGPEAGNYDYQTCIVLEQESWIAAINNPQWGIDQIYGPGTKNGEYYTWWAHHKFSTWR